MERDGVAQGRMRSVKVFLGRAMQERGRLQEVKSLGRVTQGLNCSEIHLNLDAPFRCHPSPQCHTPGGHDPIDWGSLVGLAGWRKGCQGRSYRAEAT